MHCLATFVRCQYLAATFPVRGYADAPVLSIRNISYEKLKKGTCKQKS